MTNVTKIKLALVIDLNSCEHGVIPIFFKNKEINYFQSSRVVFSSPVAYTLSARNFLYRNYHSHLPNYDGVNLRSISTVYLKSRTAEEIVHNTLAGYLVKLLEKNEGMSED